MPDTKPKDWLERATEGFDGAGGVQTAEVRSQADKDALLFGKPKPAGEEEDGDDTFIFDESDEVVKKYGQGMWRTDVVVGEGAAAKTFRYWGKTRTEVTKALIKAQQNAVPLIEEQKRKIAEISAAPPVTRQPSNLTPDTKLPFDPIVRRAPRQLTQAEILQISELQQSDPLQAHRIMTEAVYGVTPEVFAQVIDRQNNSDAKRIADEAAFKFQAEHVDDWLASPGNTALIDNYLKERKWPVTRNNLEIAFQDLLAQRKLAMPVADDEPPPAAPPNQPVIEEIVVPPPPPPVSPSSSAAPRSQAKTEADLVREAAVGIREMPLDEARASLADAFRRQRGAR